MAKEEAPSPTTCPSDGDVVSSDNSPSVAAPDAVGPRFSEAKQRRRVAGDNLCAMLCRLVHPVPMTCLWLVTLITGSTINCGWVYDWGLRSHGKVELCIFLFEVFMLLWAYLSAMMRGAGYVPLGWVPSEEELRKYLGPDDLAPLSVDLALEPDDLLQYCETCECYKPPRAHHCSMCGRCSLWMDHHCPWVGTCVGHHNLRSFTLFVHYVPLACLHAFTIHAEHPIQLSIWFYYNDGRNFWPRAITFHTLCTFVFGGLALLVACLVGALAWDMHYTLAANETRIEELAVQRAFTRRSESREPRFRYPYDLGDKPNRAAIMGGRWWLRWLPLQTPGEDVWPPVREGTGHFDLSTEAVVYKADKQSKNTVQRSTRIFERGDGRHCCGYWHEIYRRAGGSAVCCPRACVQRRLNVEEGEWYAVSQRAGDWVQATKLEHGPHGPCDGATGWILSDALESTGSAERYKVRFQDALQGSWDLIPSADSVDKTRRRVRVNGCIVRVTTGRLPFALRAESPDPDHYVADAEGETCDVTLLGVRLLTCDGVTAEWENGDVWRRAPAKDANGKAAEGEQQCGQQASAPAVAPDSSMRSARSARQRRLLPKDTRVSKGQLLEQARAKGKAKKDE